MSKANNKILKLAFEIFEIHRKVKGLTPEAACAKLKVRYTAHRKTTWLVAAAKLLDSKSNVTATWRSHISQAGRVAQKVDSNASKVNSYNAFEEAFVTNYGNLNQCIRVVKPVKKVKKNAKH